MNYARLVEQIHQDAISRQKVVPRLSIFIPSDLTRSRVVGSSANEEVNSVLSVVSRIDIKSAISRWYVGAVQM